MTMLRSPTRTRSERHSREVPHVVNPIMTGLMDLFRRSRASGLPPGTPGSRPDGGPLPQRSAPAASVSADSRSGPRERFRNTTVRSRGPLPPQRPARRPSTDRTMHSNENRLLSNSKSRRTSVLRVHAGPLPTWQPPASPAPGSSTASATRPCSRQSPGSPEHSAPAWHGTTRRPLTAQLTR